MVLNATQNARYGGGTTQRIFADGKHLLNVRMVLDGDVSDGHGPNDETDGWSGTGGVRRHQVGRQTQGTVQRALAGHAVHPGTGGQMLGEGILDDLHQTRRRSGRLDLHLVQELDHESAEALVRARDADGGVDLDQHVLGGANVDLETTGLVEGESIRASNS